MQINGPDGVEQERRRLKQENVRLREALQRFADIWAADGRGDGFSEAEFIHACERACTVLSETAWSQEVVLSLNSEFRCTVCGAAFTTYLAHDENGELHHKHEHCGQGTGIGGHLRGDGVNVCEACCKTECAKVAAKWKNIYDRRRENSA